MGLGAGILAEIAAIAGQDFAIAVARGTVSGVERMRAIRMRLTEVF